MLKAPEIDGAAAVGAAVVGAAIVGATVVGAAVVSSAAVSVDPFVPTPVLIIAATVSLPALIVAATQARAAKEEFIVAQAALLQPPNPSTQSQYFALSKQPMGGRQDSWPGYIHVTVMICE